MFLIGIVKKRDRSYNANHQIVNVNSDPAYQ